MNVPHARRSRQSTGAEHRLKMNVLGAILNDDHSTGSERFGQRRIGNDLRRGFRGRERDNLGEPAVIRYALCRGPAYEQRDGNSDQDRMLETFEQLASGNAPGGFPLSRIVCRMDWMVGDKSRLENVIEFESRVNDV
jgi:hypothetical protein